MMEMGMEAGGYGTHKFEYSKHTYGVRIGRRGDGGTG
jgi:hypothetical protein